MPAPLPRQPSPLLEGDQAGGYLVTSPSPALPSTPPVGQPTLRSGQTGHRAAAGSASRTTPTSSVDVTAASVFGGELKTHEVTPTDDGADTICCLYLVAGLPKQTATWTTLPLASDPVLSKLQHRPSAVGEWWRAEALGTNVASAASTGDGSVAGDADKQQAKLCEKALKYAFPREVEVLRSATRPESMTHAFSFALEPPVSKGGGSSGQRGSELEFHYGVTLTFYSLADDAKRSAIKKAMAIRAAALSVRSQAFNPGSAAAVDDDRSDYWLPYALTLVSKLPLYSLMADYLKISWARFSKDVSAHARQMRLALKTPVPRVGDLARLLISDVTLVYEPPVDAVELVAPMPRLDLNVGLQTAGWEMYSLFTALSLPNLLAVLDIALSNVGKVVLVSAFPALLAPCVLTLEYLCELRGSWAGLAQPLVHARDVPLLLDDQGPYILGLDVECKHLAKLAPDVCVVDLDINFINCPSPPAGLPSHQQRARALAKLRKALGEGFATGGGAGVPIELRQAYPDGRLKSHCELRSPLGRSGVPLIARASPPGWWDQSQVIQAFDRMLAEQRKKPSLLKRLSSSSLPKVKPLSEAERNGRTNMRRRSLQFMDTRDEMESKLGRLSRRLAFLCHETDIWKERFTQFEALTERLGMEADELRNRIEKERRESRRLSLQLGDREKEHVALQQKLEETEEARQEALAQMTKMAATVIRMEHDRDQMVASLDSQLDDALDRLSIDLGSPGSAVLSRAGGITSGSVSRKAPSGSAPPVSRQGSLLARRASGLHPADGDLKSSARSTKRFSATAGRTPAKADALRTLDETISARSDAVEGRMAAIQSKLDTAIESMTAYHARMPTDDVFASPATTSCRDERVVSASFESSLAPPRPASRRVSATSVVLTTTADFFEGAAGSPSEESSSSLYSEGDEEGTTLSHRTPSPDLRDSSPKDKSYPRSTSSAPVAASAVGSQSEPGRPKDAVDVTSSSAAAV